MISPYLAISSRGVLVLNPLTFQWLRYNILQLQIGISFKVFRFECKGSPSCNLRLPATVTMTPSTRNVPGDLIDIYSSLGTTYPQRAGKQKFSLPTLTRRTGCPQHQPTHNIDSKLRVGKMELRTIIMKDEVRAVVWMPIVSKLGCQG